MATATLKQQPVLRVNTGQLSASEQTAERLVRSVLCLTLRDSIAATAPAEWDMGTELLDSDDPRMQRLGILYLLHVLAQTPNTGCEMAQQLLTELGMSLDSMQCVRTA